MTQDVEEFMRNFSVATLSVNSKENCTKILEQFSISKVSQDTVRLFIDALEKECLKPSNQFSDITEELLFKLHGALAAANKNIELFILTPSNNDIDQIKYNFAVLRIILCSAKNKDEDSTLENILNNTNTIMLSRAIKSNYKNDTTKVTYKFLHTWVIPQIFAENTPDAKRRDLMDLVMSMPIGYAYNFMSQSETKEFKHLIINCYLKSIDPTQTAFEEWWKQCKVLIHYSGQLLHNDTEIANAILRVLEVGFKTKNAKDRCGSYECWKELTNNYSTDIRCLRRHIKLLGKPLKAKISKQTVVCIKRFEAYANFIEKLENDSVSTIEDFLDFSFGPLRENHASKIEEVSNPVKFLKEISPRSTEIFLKFLGHEKDTCKCKNKKPYITDTYKIKAFINPENISSHIEIFASALKVCTDVTSNWTVTGENETVINCLWWSLFKIFIHTPAEQLKPCLEALCKELQIMIKKCSTHDKYFNSTLKIVLLTMLSYLESANCIEEVQQHLVLPIIKEITIMRNDTGHLPESIFNDFIKNMLDFCNWGDEKFLSDLVDFAKTLKRQTIFNSEFVGYMLSQTDKLSASMDESSFNKRLFGKLFMISYDWFIVNEAINLSHNINDKIIRKLDVKGNMLSVMMNYQKSNPLLTKHILNQSLPLIKTIISTDEDFMNSLLELISNCISDPLLVVDKAKVLENVKLIESVRCNMNFDLHENFFKCIEALLQRRQIYDILVLLKDFSSNWNDKMKANVSNRLQDILLDLATHSDELVSENALSLITRINVDDKSKSKVKPVATVKTVTAASSPLRLLGQEVDSPIKLRGSLLDKSKKLESPKPVNQRPTFKRTENNLNDLSNKDFVVFDKEVKISMRKMSEHQAEKFMKRSDDIPALYQDLSQSLSHLSESVLKEKNVPIESSDSNKWGENSSEKPTLLPEQQKVVQADAAKSKKEEDDRKKLRAHRQLDLLKMDIVGADSFLKNLPKKRNIKRKTWSCNSEEVESAKINSKKRKSLSTETETSENDKNVENESDATKNEKKKAAEAEKDEKRTKEGVVPEKKKRGRPLKAKVVAKKSSSNELNDLKVIDKSQVISPTCEQSKDEKEDLAKDVVPNVTNDKDTKELENADSKQLEDEKEVDGIKSTSTPGGSPEILNKSSDCSDDIIPSTYEEEPSTTFRNVRVSLFSTEEKVQDKEKEGDVTETQTQTLDVAEHNGCVFSADTETMSMDISLSNKEDSPPQKDKLLCSPVNQDTPNKNKTLLNDTLNISPIQMEDPIKTVEVTRGDDVPPSDLCSAITETYDDRMEAADDDFLAVIRSPSSRSSRLLNLVTGNNKTRMHKAIIETSKAVTIQSPKTDRIRRMMQNCNKEVAVEESSKFNSNDVLKFEKAVPSPLATPRLSILKRKLSETVDSAEKISPHPKRKRVNFPDPPTTCEKIYFKDLSEKSNFRKVAKKKTPMWKPDEDQLDDSLQDMQNQIAGLGVSPLPQSPTHESSAPDCLELESTTGESNIDEDTDGIVCDVPEEVNPISEGRSQETELPESGAFSMASSILATVRSSLTMKQNFQLILEFLEANVQTLGQEERERLISILNNSS